MKQTVSDFEYTKLEDKLDRIFEVLNSNYIFENTKFIDWIEKIDYRLIPKDAHIPENKKQPTKKSSDGVYITNVTTSDNYDVSRVNYLIVAPAEIHIIEMLWSLIVGPALDQELTSDCYGNRLSNPRNSVNSTDHVGEVFIKYFDQYSAWQDKAIDCATEISDANENFALLSIDLKSYFYEINIDFEEIKSITDTFFTDKESRHQAQILNQILELIYSSYYSKIKDHLAITHPESSHKHGIPIGLASSAIIANWYLSGFDKQISTVVRPEYYGRYVDDILLVFKKPNIKPDNPVNNFIKDYLKELIKPNTVNNYSIEVGDTSLPLQSEKLILQYFDRSHSKSSLEVLKQQIQERSSAFRFLPEDHLEDDLERFAYNATYDHPAEIFKNTAGFEKTETLLAKYLSEQITIHRLSKQNNSQLVIPSLKTFFKGINTILFFRLWEKIYQYGVIINQPSFVNDFCDIVESEINKINFINGQLENKEKLSQRLIKDLKHYNNLALSLCLGLVNIEKCLKEEDGSLSDLFEEPSDEHDEDTSEFNEKHSIENYSDNLNQLGLKKGISFCVRKFRCSNFIRHNLVSWPLANYTDYEGSLIEETAFLSSSDITINDHKKEYTPRFIHFDEYLLFKLNIALNDPVTFPDWMETSTREYDEQFSHTNIDVSFKTCDLGNDSNLQIKQLLVGKNIKKSTIRLALGNTAINYNDIENSVREDKVKNISFDRQLRLYQLLNSALKENSDLFILPEVSIPVSWLPFMVSYARRNQMGMIFGLEHWVAKEKAFNLLIEVLPYKVDDKYNTCLVTARIKNHYAPAELEMLDTFRLTPGNNYLKPINHYHRIKWKGVSFATYNCFELSDIAHRSIFKSKLDLLVACVWNRDTNYYQHILESAVRDLHCYVAQSNTSQYGGSCVLQPTKTESKTLLYVKGGENSCTLTCDLNINALRDFQFKSKPNSKDQYKHLPPGYNSRNVKDR
jgi:hypothetical protein